MPDVKTHAMASDEKVQRELGVLSEKVGHVTDGFEKFLEEERSEHKIINDRIAALEKMLSEYLLTAKVSTHMRGLLIGIFGITGGAAVLKFWQFIVK